MIGRNSLECKNTPPAEVQILGELLRKVRVQINFIKKKKQGNEKMETTSISNLSWSRLEVYADKFLMLL